MGLMRISYTIKSIWMSRQVVHTRNRMVMTCLLIPMKIKSLGHMVSTPLPHTNSDCKRAKTNVRAVTNAMDLIWHMKLLIRHVLYSRRKSSLTPLTKECKLLRKFVATVLIGLKYRAILQKLEQTMFPTPIR